jgi:beta-galactosidase
MYLPGPWVRKGHNEVVVLDRTGPRAARIAGLAEPILDRLRPELDLARPATSASLQLDGVAPVHEGEFAPGAATQTIGFAAAVRGRQFCLESLSDFGGAGHAGAAEIALLGADGKALDQSNWTIAWVSSEESAKEDGSALNAINGQNSDYWHTAWSGAGARGGHPHRLVVDLGAPVEVTGMRYTARQGAEGVTGRIRQFRAYVGDALAVER